MSLTSSLQRIVQAKADIKTAIENKGVTVGDDVSIANYDDYIDAITTGGGGSTQTKTVSLSMASGDQVITPDTGYTLTQVTVEKPSTLTAENIKSGVSIGGVTGSYSGGGGGTDYDDLKGIVNGTITNFKMPSGMTEIKPYRFYQFTSLTSADLQNCTIIGDSAFYECLNLTSLTNISSLTSIGHAGVYNCQGFNSTHTLNLPASLTFIGDNAFENTKANITLQPTSDCSVGSNAFHNCTNNIEIDGKLGNQVGSSAFANSGLTKLHAQISGTVATNAFSQCRALTDVDISSSNITYIENYAFREAGRYATSSSLRLTFDFRNSTFTNIPQYIFSYGNSAYYSQYLRAFFPNTVTTIAGYAFRYNRYFNAYFLNATPPTMSNSNAWNNTTGYSPMIFVPYDNINAYKTASNWSTYASYIYGWSPENTFSLGDTLPSTNAEGKTLTWYSDETLSNAVTTVSDPTKIYYCTAA